MQTVSEKAVQEFAEILKDARKQVFSSAGNAARVIGVSEREYRDYETGKDFPSPHHVYLAGKKFQCKKLRNSYCNLVCPNGRDDSKPVNVYDLPRTTIMVEKELSDVVPVVAQLKEMVCSGEIPLERARSCIKESRELRHILESLELRLEMDLLAKEKTASGKAA